MNEVLADLLGVDVSDLEHAERNHGDGDRYAAIEAAGNSRAVREWKEFMWQRGTPVPEWC